MTKSLICIIYLILVPIITNAQVFTLKEELISKKKELTNNHIFIFEDTSAALTVIEIIHEDYPVEFQPKSDTMKSDRKSTIWIKTSVANESDEKRDLILFFNDWDVSIWALVQRDTSFLGHRGILAPHVRPEFYLGENIGSKLVIEIPRGDTITFYAKSPGFLDASAFSVAIQDLKAVTKQVHSNLWSIGIFSGCFFFILLATFFLFIKSLKRRSLFYACYCIGGFLFFSGYFGLDYFIPLRWPISYTIFLPLSSLFYLLFVFHFLELKKVKVQGKIFYTYIILLSVVVAFLILTFIVDHETYYRWLKIVNRINILFTIFSLVIIIQVPAKQKYFILGGVFFLFLGGTTYVYMKEFLPENHSFIYPMMGYMLEMTTFLIGGFYVQNVEHRQSMQKLHENEKELVKKKEELIRFTSIIKEKNKLIGEFKDQLEAVEGSKQSIIEPDMSFNNTVDHLMQSTILTPDEWTEFKKLFSQVYPGFLGNVRNKYPDLTETEERLLTLTKLNLSNREISSMLGISTDSVYKSRYRLSKKLEVPSEEIETIVAEL